MLTAPFVGLATAALFYIHLNMYKSNKKYIYYNGYMFFSLYKILQNILIKKKPDKLFVSAVIIDQLSKQWKDYASVI